jgi:hypothetical protein
MCNCINILKPLGIIPASLKYITHTHTHTHTQCSVVKQKEGLWDVNYVTPITSFLCLQCTCHSKLWVIRYSQCSCVCVCVCVCMCVCVCVCMCVCAVDMTPGVNARAVASPWSWLVLTVHNSRTLDRSPGFSIVPHLSEASAARFLSVGTSVRS